MAAVTVKCTSDPQMGYFWGHSLLSAPFQRASLIIRSSIGHSKVKGKETQHKWLYNRPSVAVRDAVADSNCKYVTDGLSPKPTL